MKRPFKIILRSPGIRFNDGKGRHASLGDVRPAGDIHRRRQLQGQNFVHRHQRSQTARLV